jgi:hypothetical protein
VNKDLNDIAHGMDKVAGDASDEGLAMHEYDEYKFDPQFRQRVRHAMTNWERACEDLYEAAEEMLKIAQEMPDL